MTSFILAGLLLTSLAITSARIFSPSRISRIILVCLDILIIVVYGSYNLLLQGVELPHIGLGFVGGQFVFFISLCLVNLSPYKAWKAIHPLGGITRGYLNLKTVFRYLIISGFEEILWRGTAQGFLGNSATAMLVTSVFFLLRHLGSKETFYLMELLDLFLFSCLLGILFLTTQSIYLVIVVHAVRNVNLSYLRSARRNLQTATVAK